MGDDDWLEAITKPNQRIHEFRRGTTPASVR
jgi:hypothetical protein